MLQCKRLHEGLQRRPGASLQKPPQGRIQVCPNWDPSWAYPWLLYNTPSGLGYFDQIYGFNAWPPQHLVDPATGAALPLLLKGPWAKLAPTLIDWGQLYVPIANLTYALLYQIDPTAFGALLTPAAIWGL